jgi:hypothetical protein
MKTIAISLLLGAGALSLTVPASAGEGHSERTTAGSTAFAQADMSSRHRRYRVSHRHYHVSRVAVTPRSFRPAMPLTPLVAPPYVITYRTYGRVWGPPAPYVAAAPGVYAYGPYPYSDPYGYAPVRFAPNVLYDTSAAIGGGGFAVAVPGTTW